MCVKAHKQYDFSSFFFNQNLVFVIKDMFVVKLPTVIFLIPLYLLPQVPLHLLLLLPLLLLLTGQEEVDPGGPLLLEDLDRGQDDVAVERGEDPDSHQVVLTQWRNADQEKHLRNLENMLTV